MNNETGSRNINGPRRTLLKRAAYVVPAVITLSVFPTLAAAGSSRSRNSGPDCVDDRR